MAAPGLVLFDLDGVLAHYAHAPRLRMLAERTGASEAAITQALFASGLEAEADLGRHDAHAQAQALSRRLGRPVAVADLVAARRAAMTADAEVVASAGAVARQARVAILTNNNLLLRDHLPEICPPLFPMFAGRVFCSAQYGVGKPAPDVFRRCLADLGTAPGDAFFVDDKPENADGARRAGLRAHHYRDPATLRSGLRSLGLPES